MVRKRTAIVLAAVAFITVCIHAQDQADTVRLSIGQIAELAQSRNLEILKAGLIVERARDDLQGEPELINSTVSVQSGYPYAGVGSELSLPLVPQITVGAGFVMDRYWQTGESFSLSIEPFEPRRHTYSEEKALKLALAGEHYLERAIYLDAEQAALDLLIRDMDRQLARSAAELEQRRYELARKRQELGEASFQDVQDRLLDLLEVQEKLYDTEQRYLSDWKSLQMLFAPSERLIAVTPLSVDELLGLSAARAGEVERYRDAQPLTKRLQDLRLELAALQAEREVTPAWRPDLDLTVAAASPTFSPVFGLTFSFSPNQLKRDEREDLAEDIEVKRMEIAAERYAAGLQKMLEQQSIAIVEQALLTARTQRERDRIALREAELLFQQGKRTTLELEQLRLNLRRSEILTFQAASEVYRVMGEYLLLFLDA